MNKYEVNMYNSFLCPMFILDTIKGKVTFINNSFSEIMDQDEFDINKVIINYDNQDFIQIIRENLLENEEFVLENLEFKNYNGEIFSTKANIGYTSIYKDSVYVIMQETDELTELKHFKNIIVNFPDPTIVVSLNDNLDLYYTNEAFDRIFSTGGNNFGDIFNNKLINALTPNKKQEYIDSIYAQMKEKGTFRVEIEMIDASREPHAVYLSGVYINSSKKNNDKMYCRLHVMDEKVGLMKLLEIEKNFYNAVQSLSTNLIIKVDLVERRATYLKNSDNCIILPENDYNFPVETIEFNSMHKDDIKIFEQLVQDMYKGDEHKENIRMLSSNGQYEWCEYQYLVTKNAKGTPIEAVAKITNVQEIIELEEQATIDTLTGCLLKDAFEKQVIEDLRKSSNSLEYAILIIDVDNFKGINDNLGHQFGDDVLEYIGSGLRSLFRGTDYVGRIGGDEFMVFMENTNNKIDICKKCDQILELLSNKYTVEERNYEISGSVGIALYPQDGKNFEDLYKRADIALYDSKHLGKNKYTFYDVKLTHGTMSNTTPFEVASRTLSQFFDAESIDTVFDILMSSKNYDDGLNNSLEYIGQRVNASRAYILEVLPSGGYINTYEWCDEKTDAQIEHMKYIDKEVIDVLWASANDQGVLYCNDISTITNKSLLNVIEKQSIKSFLQAHIHTEGCVKYLVGFDDCEYARHWKPIDISTLIYTTKVISQYMSIKEKIQILKETTELQK